MPPAVIEEDEEAAGLLADVREQQQRFVGLHRAREELRKGLKPPAALKLHVQRLQQDRSQLQRRVAQAQTNLSSVPDADAIKVRCMQIRASAHLQAYLGMPSAHGLISEALAVPVSCSGQAGFRSMLGAYTQGRLGPQIQGPLAQLHQRTASVIVLQPMSGELGASPELY